MDAIAQLNDRSVTEEIRLALEDWIERSKADPKVLARAETVRADIERDAQTKRNAIEAIFANKEGEVAATLDQSSSDVSLVGVQPPCARPRHPCR